MAGSLYFYLLQPVKITEELLSSHQEEFDKLLEDSFTDEELSVFENKIDALAAVTSGPLLSELTFEDFYAAPNEEEQQRRFFTSCQSSISFENLPYLETNPFQVTYLQELLKKFEEVLVDRGGVSELTFKKEFVADLSKKKNIDVFLGIRPAPEKIKKIIVPVDPIDFLVVDVYKGIEKLQGKEVDLKDLPLPLHKLYFLMKKEQLDPAALYMRSGLNAKDFDDGLERLKFYLRKFL